jgi:hypothetical protein
MILVRTIFHARHGKINQLVEGFKQATHDVPERPMMLTDLAGRSTRWCWRAATRVWPPMSNVAPSCSRASGFRRARPPWTI